MQTLRVLHVTPYGADAWAYGGIPRLSHSIVRGLAARGHRVTVCTTDACDATRRLARPAGGRVRTPWPPQQCHDNIELRIFPNLSNRLAYAWQGFLPIGLDRYMRVHAASFDVAHLHACRNVPGAIAARRLRRAGVPYVLAPNGTAPNIERRRATKYVFDVVAGHEMLAGAARVLAVTEAERRQLAALNVPPERIRVVPNPVDLDEFITPPAPGAFRQRSGIEGPLVVFLGQLTPRKRVEMLVRAFADLGRHAAHLVIAGNDMGAEPAARAAAASLGVADRTMFCGLVEGRARLELLADADVVVYPSEHEIFGLVPLEAVLAGTPVVVSDDSGCGEVIGSIGGGLVVPGNPVSLRAAITRILESPHRWRTAAIEAAQRVRARYAPDAVCAQLELVYGEMAAAR
jgi:glycosyltransferase involved in cell wall biosynthesis